MEDNGQLIQVIIGVLIGAAYVVSAAVKRIDAWIQTHRMPPEQRRAERRPLAPLETPQEPLPDLKTILMRELEKALEPEKQAAPKQLPELASAPLFPHYPAAPGKMEPDHQQPRAAAGIVPKPKPRPKQVPAMPRARQSSAGLRIRGSELLHEPSDMGRAIILHEILSPPLSVRRRRASGFPHRV